MESFFFCVFIADSSADSPYRRLQRATREPQVPFGRILPSFTELSLIFLASSVDGWLRGSIKRARPSLVSSFTGFYRVLPSFPMLVLQLYRGLPSFNGFYWVLLVFVWFYWV